MAKLQKPITKTKGLYRTFEIITQICQTSDHVTDGTIMHLLKTVCDEAYMDGREDEKMDAIGKEIYGEQNFK